MRAFDITYDEPLSEIDILVDDEVLPGVADDEDPADEAEEEEEEEEEEDEEEA
jgi:hypothetical protein